MRSGETLNDAVRYLTENGVELAGVNENPSQKSWTTSPKAYAQLYIDDAALGCPLVFAREFSDRPFVNWGEVRSVLKAMKLI
jgi:hypothetical protein